MSRKYFLIVTIIALGAFLRFYLLRDIPPGLYPDEAMNGVDALTALNRADFRVFYTANNGREGLFINLQALSVQLFGTTAWALRAVSAAIGTLTVFFFYLLAREIGALLFSIAKSSTREKRLGADAAMVSERSEDEHRRESSGVPRGGRNDRVFSSAEAFALLASFLLAVSFWHVNFSRIGFRAIMLPLLSSAAFFFLLRAVRERRLFDFAAGGVFSSLALSTYIAARMIPIVVVVLAVMDAVVIGIRRRWFASWALFGLLFLVTMLPLGGYFLAHPEDFIGRAGDVSVFQADHPVRAALISKWKTLLMFNIHGDENWRHNVAGSPMFDALTGAAFLLGIVAAVSSMFKKKKTELRFGALFISAWFFLLLVPSIATAEGLPHALRSLGALPPALLLASWGGMIFWQWSMRIRVAHSFRQAGAVTCLMIILVLNVQHYFFAWAGNNNVQGAFRADLAATASFLSQRSDYARYVIVNENGTLLDGVPVQSATIRFLTADDPTIRYLTPERISEITPQFDATLIVTTVMPSSELEDSLRSLFPSMLRSDEQGVFVYSL